MVVVDSLAGMKQQGSCYRRAKILYSRRLKRYRREGTSTTAAKVNQKQKVAQADQKVAGLADGPDALDQACAHS